MNSSNSLSVLHVLKYKSWSTLSGLEKHLCRSNNPSNVNHDKSHLNRVLIGSDKLCFDAKSLLAEMGISKLRKNGVLALEIVLSFSRSFIFNDDDTYKHGANEKYKDWVKSSKKWLKDEFGKNCIHASLHLDETTPHIHAVIIPVSERVNKHGKKLANLNARGITGGKEKLSLLQDKYAAAVEHLGIKRGLKGSKAKRTSLEQYYKALQESKEICAKTGLIPPNSNPESFNSWQAIVRKVSDSLESQQSCEVINLKKIIKELVDTNKRLRQELVVNHQRPSYPR